MYVCMYVFMYVTTRHACMGPSAKRDSPFRIPPFRAQKLAVCMYVMYIYVYIYVTTCHTAFQSAKSRCMYVCKGIPCSAYHLPEHKNALYACMYICIYVQTRCMYVCIYVYMYKLAVCMYVRMYVCNNSPYHLSERKNSLHVCMYMYVCTNSLYAYMYTCMYVCMYIYIYICMYVCM